MSKTMKKFISMLLCLAMALTSIGLTVFADDETTAATTATETAENAAETEPEEKPTSAPYEGDVYYERALSLCSTLGIIQGYEDGSVQPESTVTRAEMAAIILRMLNTDATSTYANSFNDVTSAHWAADTVQTAANLGIISGMGDGSFLPDGNVMYEQVAKMIVCALGFDTDAKLDGGYPDGYLRVVNNLDINEHAEGAKGVVAERGTVIKLVYNALLTKMNEIAGTDSNGNVVYNATRTLAKIKFGVIDAKGILTATAKRSIVSGTELKDNQVLIDGAIYETELTGLEEYVGLEITYFYKENKDIEPTVVAISASATKSETIEILPDDIKSISNIDGDNGVIYMENGAGNDKKCKIKQIVYNDEVITRYDYERAKANDAAAQNSEKRFYERDIDGSVIGSDAMSFEEFLIPKVGTIKLTDSDDDGYYDYMFVDSYDTMLVTSVGSKTLAGEINGTDVSFNVDTTTNSDLEISVTKAGSEAKVRNLKKNDVVSLKRNFDNTKMTMIVTGESIIGTIASIQDKEDARYIEVGDAEYPVDANAFNDAKTGASATLYMDAFGRVGYIDSSSSGKLSGAEKYAWIMNAYKSADDSDYVLLLYTQDGKAEEYTLGGTVTYWGPKNTSATSLSGDAKQTILNELTGSSSKYLYCNSYQIRLCKIKANTNKEIISLYVATEASKVSDDAALVVDTKDLRNMSSVGSKINGRLLKDGIVGFAVPKDVSDMRTESEYSVFSVSASSYLNSQGGVNRNFILGEFDDGTAGILVQFNDGSSTAADVSNYGTASDNSCMLVSSIGKGVNEDGDTIYTIRGMRGGSEVKYTTTTTTSLVALEGTSVFSDKETYNTTSKWTGADETPLTDYLRSGDVVGIATSGTNANVIIKMADVNKIAQIAADTTGVAQFVGYGAASETRDGIGIGAVANVTNDDSTYFDYGSNTWVLSSSVSIDLVNITTDEAGNVTDIKVTKDTIEPAELVEFELDSSKPVGDYIFFRHFKNSAQREAVVFRFNY